MKKEARRLTAQMLVYTRWHGKVTLTRLGMGIQTPGIQGQQQRLAG